MIVVTERAKEHKGLTVLLIDEELLAMLESMTVDCRETPEGPRLVIGRSAGGKGDAPRS